MSYSGATIIWVFHLPQQRYFYLTWSSMTELLLSVSQHWNLHLCYGTLWALTILFYFLLFFRVYFSFSFLFILKDDEEACDNEVTWQVTWRDITSLEHDGRVWKITSGHMEYTWWSWIEYEAGMRIKYRH